MNSKIIAGIIVLVVGLLILIILPILGGVAKKTIDDTIYSRLEYERPKGYKNNENFEQCFHSDHASFDEEYYLWNLTNLAETLAGEKPHYNLTGPFSYTKWYCEYDHQIDKENGILRYREYDQGYMFMRQNSVGPDDMNIININLGYLGLLKSLAAQGANDAIIPELLTTGLLQQVITGFKDPATITQVQQAAVPTVLATVNNGLYDAFTQGAYQTLISRGALDNNTFFNPSYVNPAFGLPGFSGYTKYLTDLSLTAPTDNNLLQLFYAQWFYPGFTGLKNFPTTYNASYLETAFGLPADVASATVNYATYLFTFPNARAAAQQGVYTQWAQHTLNTGIEAIPIGWALALSSANPTNLSISDVGSLFSATSSCSLVGPSYATTWLPAVVGGTRPECAGLTLSDAQKDVVVAWLKTSFIAFTVNFGLLQTWGITDWSDFAYVQWGQLVAGQSLGGPSNPKLPFQPEFYYFTKDLISQPACSFNLAQAKSILNAGPTGMLNITNLIILERIWGTANVLKLQLPTAAQLAQISAVFPVAAGKEICFGSYFVDYIKSAVVVPQITAAKASGGDMFTTRTVRQWLFGQSDPLLGLLGTPTVIGYKTNTTQTKENAYEYPWRIYTGDNDLHWSLMPYTEANETEYPYWRTPVPITGFNGTQFLPDGYLDDEKKMAKNPLVLWHEDIARPIPFKVVGKTKWNGVHARYITLADDALASESSNPANAPYYAVYNGLINKTSNPPLLPIFLSTPNFLSADPVFYENVTFTDDIYSDYDPSDQFSLHRRALFILVEPTLGSAIWGNLPIQINVKYGPTAQYPKLLPSVAPVYWKAIGDIATKKDLDDIKTTLYGNIKTWKALIGVGFGLGVPLTVAGIVLVHHFKKHENELQEVGTSSTR